MAPRVLVFGAGSLGVVYTWIFSRALPESNITAVCRSNYDAAARDGFTVHSTIWGRGLSVRPQLARSASEAAAAAAAQSPPQPFDYVVVTTKALPTTPSTAELIRPAVTPGVTTIVLVQNGIGIEEEYAQLYADDDVPILSVVVFLPATQTSPAVVEHEIIEHSHVGTYPASGVPGSHKEAARGFVELLRNAGATATLHDDVQAERWGKLLINGSWNPICALSRLRDKQFANSGRDDDADEDKPVQLIREVMLEIAAVARACGHEEINEELVELRIGHALSRPSPGIQPSMMADALAMRALEADAIVGNVVRIAKQKNVPVPMLRAIYLLTRALSQSFSLPKES